VSGNFSAPSLEDVIRSIVREEISLLSPPPPDLMDYNDAAIYLKRTVTSLRNLVDRKKIPYTKAGSRVRFIKSELDKWLEEGRNG